MKKPLLLILFLMLSVSVHAAQNKSFRLEGVMADPQSSLRHFMVDSDGAWHAERGKPATKQSPSVTSSLF